MVAAMEEENQPDGCNEVDADHGDVPPIESDICKGSVVGETEGSFREQIPGSNDQGSNSRKDEDHLSDRQHYHTAVVKEEDRAQLNSFDSHREATVKADYQKENDEGSPETNASSDYQSIVGNS